MYTSRPPYVDIAEILVIKAILILYLIEIMLYQSTANSWFKGVENFVQ